MKKRLLTLCLSLIVVFSLTSCGADLNAQKEIYGENRAEIEKDMIQMAQTVNSMNDSELQQLSDKYVNLAEEAKTEVDKNQANMYAQFLSSVKETNGELGKFEEFGDMTEKYNVSADELRTKTDEAKKDAVINLLALHENQNENESAGEWAEKANRVMEKANALADDLLRKVSMEEVSKEFYKK